MGPDIFDEIGFEPADEARWRALVAKALKGADFDATLVSRTDDGIAYGPIAGRDVHDSHVSRRDTTKPWTIVQRVDDPDGARAGDQIAADREGGATGFAICLAGAPSGYGFGITADALTEHLSAIGDRSIRFEAAADALPVILDALKTRERAAPVHLGLDIASFPDEALAAKDVLAGAMRMADAATVFRADGRIAHNAGASEGQELAFMLAALAETLRFGETEGLDLTETLQRTELALAADQNQFLTIAKLKAARLLHARFSEACGLPVQAPHLHVETSFRMLAVSDFETNILRNTIAVFAAGVAGADSIAVLPHTLGHGLPDRFARRIARNTQTVLIDESHLAHVADPASGAGGIAHLTDALCQTAWRLFQEIEAEGGIRRSLADGHLNARIAQTAEARTKAIREGKQAIVGTTVYPPDKERPLSILAWRDPGMAHVTPLAPRPLHEGFGEGDAA